MRRCLLFLLPVIGCLTAATARAEMFGPDFTPCGDKTSTVEIVACVQGKTKAADRRLNDAYKAIQARLEQNQIAPLKAAQRLWVQYRDANCRFYGSGDGSISQLQAAECFHAMTLDRAIELEKALKED